MKSKFSYKSKRTIIIAAIITVLLAGTATGVYFFTKGNAQAQAAGDNNTTQEQYGEAPEENKNEQQNNTTENEQNKNEQGETTLNQQEEQETERQEQTTNNNQTTQNEQTTTTTTGEVPNQEYVTEREETVKNPWETLEVGWGPTQFASIASTANLTAKKSNLEIHKTVDKESVKIGDTLTYTISVKNNGDKVAKAIIYDNVPEGTVLLNKDNNEDENTKKLTWRVTVEPGETENVEFTVRVKAEKGTIKNSAIVNGKTTEETETGIINITGKKEVDKAEAKVGDTLTYTITLTNSGNATGTVTVTDEIPAGTTLVEKSITNNGVESNGTITWTDVEVKAGKTAEVSFKVTINSDTKTSVTNKAVIDGNKPTEEVETKVANITGAKSVDKSTAKVGDTLTYTITLTNNGNADGKVTVTDEVPTGTTLVADSITANGSYNEENKTITWTDVKVEAGKTAEVSFKVTINSDTKTSVTNKAVIDGNKPTEEVETKVANITGAKSVDKSTAKVGDTLTYTITLTNNGNADGKVTVTDEIPTGTRIKDENTTGYNKETNTMTWSNVEVKANGGTATLTLEVVVKDDTTDTVKNVAKIDNKEIPEKPETKVANITGAKSVDKPTAKVGDTLTYTIKLTNSGNGDGKVTVTDEIPTGTRIKDENTTGYNKETNTMTWSNVEVKANGGTATLTLEVVVKDDTTDTVKNVAKIDNKEIPEKPETKVANITGAKSVDKPTAKVGDTLTYTIKLTNSGNGDGKVTVTDEIPTGTRIKDENTTGYNKETNTMTWSNVEVKANGGTATLTLEVVVKDDTTDTVKNVAKIDNKEIPEKPETKVANITGAKSVDKPTAKVGDTLTYTIKLTNSGNGDGKVTVTDEIPTGTRIKDENTTGYNKETNTMTWSNVEVKANGGTATLTLEVVVEDNISIIKNIAYVDGNKIPEEPETSVRHHYTVEHYTENLDGKYSKVEKDTVVSEDVEIGTKVSYENNNYEGFTFDDSKTENKDATVPDNNNLVVKLYYTRRNDLSYTVYYKEQGTETKLADAKVVDGKTFGDVVTENAIDIDGYNKVNPTSAEITITTGKNEYTFYYTKRTDLSYTVNYYYNGKLGFREYFDNMEYLYEISGVDPKPEYNGITYTKYDLKTSSENGLLPLIIGTGSNYINVYYGTPNVTISKKVNETAVKVGDTLHYTIKVTETRGLVDASGINVTDPIPEGLENVRNITHNGNLNEGNVEWNNLTITKNSSITLEFDATVSATTIGKTISNTANLGGTTSGDSNTVTTTVSELKAAVKEIKKGTTGKDAVNVVLVMDLSYSMQEKKTTDNVTRLEAAKKAATKFINSIYTKDPNSKVTVTVLTFNTKNPVTGIVGKTECTAWHNHDRHGCKKINGVWYSDWEETTETLPYSGTLKLGFADKTNYSSLVSKIEEITLPDSNPSYNDGWNTTGLGTNVYEALQLTESTVKELETNHSENSNVVILLSDGAPTTSYSGNSSLNEYEELRNKASEIKGNPITTEFYSIQFGTEDGAYGLLQAMSSNNSVYTSNSIDTLVENFTNILEQNITKDPIDTVNGKYTTTLSNPLVVDADNPITVTYEGTTLFTCTSLPSNGLTYDSTTKTISWDINAWNAVEGHPKVTTNNIVIQCYVER